MAVNEPAEGKIEMVVTGKKGVHYRDAEGKGAYAKTGDHIYVTPATAESFSDRLTAPQVVEAQKTVDAAMTKAKAEAEVEVAATAQIDPPEEKSDAKSPGEEEDEEDRTQKEDVEDD